MVRGYRRHVRVGPVSDDPVLEPPVPTVEAAVARMEAIDAALPPADGVWVFNHIYLHITRLVGAQITAGFYVDDVWMAHLDVVFANLYLTALRAAATEPDRTARCWAPLIHRRSSTEIEPIQFAFAGLNAHMNHDLAVAVATTCAERGTDPDDGGHHDDFTRIDDLLATAVEEVRQSFESGVVLGADRKFRAALNLVCNWSIVDARAAAWTNAEALWELRRVPRLARDYRHVLDGTVGMAGRALLVDLPG
jgi:hypothetical protein